MTDGEINRRLAGALGWVADDTSWYGDPGLQIPAGTWRDKDGNDMAPMYGLNPFSPATDPNHLRAYVLPEVERRGLWTRFVLELISTIKPTSLPDAGYVDDFGCGLRCGITAEPRVLALAALRVMGG